MDYKIITDTSCDLSKDMSRDLNITYVPFYITIDGVEYIDNDELDVNYFIGEMMKSSEPIRTACASSFEYAKALNDCDENNIFVVTISSKVSGSYNSAKIAVDEFKKENPEKNVYLVDSESASAGHTSLVLKIVDIIKEESSFNEKVTKIDKMVEDNRTYFILESLDNLIKNGRINKKVGGFANFLNIKPIMKAEHGEIAIHEVNRGFKKALTSLAKQVGADFKNILPKRIIISYVNCEEKADFLEEKIRELTASTIEIIKVPTKGLASAYADNGGIVIGF